MKTLEKILKQDVVVMNETVKLKELQQQYIKEVAKYKIGQIVKFRESETLILKGRIRRISFVDTTHGMIQYSLKRLTKNGFDHKGDNRFYYVYEKFIL